MGAVRGNRGGGQGQSCVHAHLHRVDELHFVFFRLNYIFSNSRLSHVMILIVFIIIIMSTIIVVHALINNIIILQ